MLRLYTLGSVLCRIEWTHLTTGTPRAHDFNPDILKLEKIIHAIRRQFVGERHHL
jgi:hypothetical protein